MPLTHQAVLSVKGLTPGKAYISHFHAFGPDFGTDPCAPNGPVTVGFPNFTADASQRHGQRDAED